MARKDFELREYQKNARDDISNDCIDHLENSPTSERTFYLQAPTGAGKTAILSKAIRRIYKSQKVAFVWLTIGDGGLAEQSKGALEDYLNGSGIRPHFVEDALRDCAHNMAGRVVVVNYDLLNKVDKDGKPISTFMKDGERVNFPEMCANTRAQVPIVLIIDEAHTHADTEKSRKIWQEVIAPTYIIRASATLSTPGGLDGRQSTKIKFAEVARSKMIKKRIRVNEFASHNDGVPAAAEKLVKLIAMTKEVREKTLSDKGNYHPKMLVFVPNADAKGNNGEVEDILLVLNDRFGWNEPNGKVKLWFSGDRKSPNIEECKENLDETRVIITKEAIDTGIDIPSIQVIVQLRPTKNPRVHIQKIGRGMRMPEQDHYGNDLDTLFFYAFPGINKPGVIDWGGFEEGKELFEGLTINVQARFQDSLSSFPKIETSRIGRYPSVIEMSQLDFEAEACPIIKDKVNAFSGFDFSEKPAIDLPSWDLDMDAKKLEKAKDDLEKAFVGEGDIGTVYDRAVHECLGHLYKHRAACISDVLNDVFQLTNDPMRKFALANISTLKRLINEAVREVEADQPDPMRMPFDFVPPQSYSFTTDNPVKSYTNFLYDQCVQDRNSRKSDLERNFEEFLVSNKNVLWWSRNYDRGGDDDTKESSFSVVYPSAQGSMRLKNFFPDFIIQLIDGRIFIVDTKGNTDKDEEPKKEALIACLKGLPNVSGGIVKLDKGSFYIDYGSGSKSVDELFASKQ
jgi:type III restriction enzyme